MDKQQATAFIVERLEKDHSCDDIVRALWEQTGWPTEQITRFVRQVEAKHRERAATQTAPPTQRRAEFAMPRETAESVEPLPRQPRARREASDQRDKATEFVISALGQHRNHDDIIRALCERHDWSWKEARIFVRRVEIEHHGDIAARQSPFVIVLGVGIVLGGLFLAGYVAYLTLNGEYINLAGMPVPYLENGVYFVTGVGMVIGGIAGIWRAISMVRE